MKLRRFLSALAFVVVLTPNGFEPKTLTVPVGVTVTFQTTRGRFFWPASNEHPAHSAYPEFDPKRPVDPEDSWSFRFDKEGVWNFHDHISPNFIGVIEVTGSGQLQKASEKKSIFSYVQAFIARHLMPLDYSSCGNPALNRSERIGCWEKIVVTLVQRSGLQKALVFVDRQKNRDTAFAADCHVYAHRIGEEYYWKFFNNRKIEVSDKFDLCDDGFFHGFMQEFTSHGQNIVEAKRYCDLLISGLHKSEDSDMLALQCYHGIGHGLAFMYAPLHWGDNDEIMRRAVADCRTMFPDAPRFCISGVYGGLAAMHWHLHGFTITMDLTDPFALCKDQKELDKKDCMDQLVPVLFSEMNLDLEKAGRFIESVPNEETAMFLMEHLGSMPSYTLVPKTDDYRTIIEACRAFRAPLSSSCLRGFARSLARIGSVKDGQARFVKFCESDIVTEEEKPICLQQ